MKAVFEILPGSIDTGHTTLFCEISDAGIAYAFQQEGTHFTGLSIHHFDKAATPEDIEREIKNLFSKSDLLRMKFKKVYILYSLRESVLVPEKYYKSATNAAILDFSYGDIEPGVVLTEHMPKRELFNVYRVPTYLHKLMAAYFPGSAVAHQYTFILQQLPFVENFMKVIFYPEKIVVALAKDFILQIIQTFDYNTAEDVAYHLLNLKERFALDEIHVVFSGMIDVNSALFTELSKYFLNIEFENVPTEFTYVPAIGNHPAHFFTHLFSIAQCV